MIKVAPSILSADFSDLGGEIASIQFSGADYVHFDVMDGHFVPNLTVGIPVLKSVRKCTELPIDAHLMISNPLDFVSVFCDSGADIVTIHAEAASMEEIQKCIDEVHSRGKKFGLSIKPNTSDEIILSFLSQLDLALVMTVEPGFGGQKFIETMLPQIANIRKAIENIGSSCELEVDGGINESTAPLVVRAGADVLVAGSAFFSHVDRVGFVDLIKHCEVI